MVFASGQVCKGLYGYSVKSKLLKNMYIKVDFNFTTRNSCKLYITVQFGRCTRKLEVKKINKKKFPTSLLNQQCSIEFYAILLHYSELKK